MQPLSGQYDARTVRGQSAAFGGVPVRKAQGATFCRLSRCHGATICAFPGADKSRKSIAFRPGVVFNAKVPGRRVRDH